MQDTIAAASLVKLPSPKPSEISTKPVDMFVENLGRWKVGQSESQHFELCLKSRQYLQGIELLLISCPLTIFLRLLGQRQH